MMIGHVCVGNSIEREKKQSSQAEGRVKKKKKSGVNLESAGLPLLTAAAHIFLLSASAAVLFRSLDCLLEAR